MDITWNINDNKCGYSVVKVVVGLFQPEQANPIPLPQTTPLTLINGLMLIWAVGAALFLAYQFAGYFAFRKKALRWGKKPTDVRIINKLNGLAIDMGLRKEITILINKNISSPMMTGFIKPLLILPIELYSDTDLDFILRHELTHYKRHDLCYKLFLVFVNAVHWFNPFIYLLLREANADLELSCDDKVINGLSCDERRMYSEAILASMTAPKPFKLALSTNFYGGRKTIKSRFANIFNTKKKKNGAIILLIVIMIVGILGGLVAYTATKPNEIQSSESGMGGEMQIDPGFSVLADALYQYRDTYAGDNSKVVAIINLLPIGEFLVRGNVYLATQNTPYGVEVNYQTHNDRAEAWKSMGQYEILFKRNAAIMFALITNMDSLSINISDKYNHNNQYENGFMGFYIIFEDLNHSLGTNYFTQENLATAVATQENFREFINQVMSVSMDSQFDQEASDESKVINNIIGEGWEVRANSGTGANFVLEENIITSGFDLAEAAKTNNIDIEEYYGKEIYVCTISAINYAGYEPDTSYVFVFCENKLIAYENIGTDEKAIELAIYCHEIEGSQ